MNEDKWSLSQAVSRWSVGTPHEWRKSVWDEKWALSQAVSRIGELSVTTELSAAGTKRDVQNTLKMYSGPAIQALA